MTKKVHKLQYTPEYLFLLIGISSHQNDYRLSWAINNKLNLKLIKTENLKIVNKKLSVTQFFSVYNFDDEDNQLIYNLISNRCDNGFLLEELKNIDFLLQVLGDTNESYIKNLLKGLKEIDIINTSFTINADSLKSRQKLIF